MVPWAIIAQKIAGAAGETAQFASPIAQSLGKAATQQRKMVRADVEKMKRGQLGYSEAKTRRKLEEALGSARAQGVSGSNLAQMSAKQMQAINTDSEQQAILRRAEILKRLKEQAARNASNWQESTKHVGRMLGANQKGGSGGLDLGSLAATFGG